MQLNETTVENFVIEIRDKAMMHEALVRHGFFLPDINASICTEAFLEGVASKIIWCPLISEIKLKPCPHSPTKKILWKKLRQYLSSNRST